MKEGRGINMGKSMIIETQDANTVYEEGKSKGILGKLKGVFADFKHGTRNADRLYSEELWDNRVFNNEDVMEALETKTLFGELDHPDGDRCETKAQNAAITITKLEKRPEEGVIYGEAEILDTPTGKIVKALADSGAKLGISSRGIGEEIYENGQNIIDPETYDFITFDVVVTPANKKARVSLAESKQINKLNESFERAINESDTKNQLNQIKEAVDNTNNINKSNLLNLIETKKLSLSSNKENKLLESNKQLAFNLLKEKYIENKNELKESITASNNLGEENKKLIEELDYYKNSKEDLKTKLKESISSKNELNAIVENLQNENQSQKTLLEESNKKIQRLQTKTKILEKQKSNIINKKVEDLQSRLNAELSKNESLAKSNAELSKNLEDYSKIILENKQLTEQLNNLNKNKLIESKKIEQEKSLQENKIKELQQKITLLEQQAKKTENIEDRFSKLAFDPIGNIKVVAENFKRNDLSQEDIDLYNALTNK
jgi:hypothetical protein